MLLGVMVTLQVLVLSLRVRISQEHQYIGVAQLVEFVVWDHAVAGSSPVTYTIKNSNSLKEGNESNSQRTVRSIN